MAKNSGKGFRKGAVNDRSQMQNPKDNNWIKRNCDNGRFMEEKQDGKPFKGIAHEKDGRRK